MNQQIEEIKRKIFPILQKHGVTRAGIFGSYVRDEEGTSSDVDLLVEIGNNMGLLDFIGIKLELEEILGRKVDLIEYNMIKPLLRERILSEQVIIL